MVTYVSVILVYLFLFFRNRNLAVINHYGDSLTLSIWMLLAYLFCDKWVVYVMLLILTGGAVFALSYYWAKMKGTANAFSDYAVNSYKTENSKVEWCLFIMYFLILSPLIERLDAASVYRMLIPAFYFIIERVLYFCLIRKDR